MKQYYLLSISLLLITVVAFGQRVTISGTLSDAETGDALVGATIVESGTTNGTVTDIDGNYQLSVSNENATIDFSYIGYETQSIPLNGRSQLDVELALDISQLEEVVVVGYGTQKQKDLTSAISTVKAEEIVKSPSGQTMQALQGKVAGLQIVSAGSPGSEPTVRIRGIGSFPGSSNSAPLYVVDGMFFDNIDFLNPSDIKSLSVLKDASAAAIYGVRAANGVILITTKSGSLNAKPTITYDGYVGMQVPQNVLKMANAEQFVNYINQTGSAVDISYIDNAMQRFGRSKINPNVPDVNTDWYAEIMEPALQQNHSLTIAGGSNQSSYSVGVNYFEQDGLLQTKNSYQRVNIRTKLDQEVNNWLKVGLNLNLSQGIRYLPNDAAWFSAYHAVPILPVFDDANYADLLASETPNASPYASAQLLDYRGAQNPYLNLDYRDNRQDIRKVLAGLYAQVDLIENKLVYKINYNVSLLALKARSVLLPYWVSNETNRPLSSINTSRTTDVNQFLDNTLTYTESFGDHNVTAMVGTSFRDEWYDFLRGSADDIPLNENSWYIGQTQSETSKEVDDNAERIYGLSYFGRLAYNFKNRYIAYFTLRRDGTSKYQEKWGTFPAFGLGWVLSEESFMQGVPFIDFLKIRGGWGQLGNDKITRQDGANTTNPVFLAIDDTQVNGTKTTSTFGYLGWETVTGTNIGISGDFFKGSLSLEADYFIRDTENAAIPVSLKLQSGSVLKNVGTIRNQGLEVALNYTGKISQDLQYSIGGNIATLKNEVTDLFGQEYINGGQAEFRQRSQIGEPLLSFYGYEVAGVYQTQEEVDADQVAIDNGLVPGDLRFVDQNNDDLIDDNDKVFLGSYFPDLTYGGSLGLKFKNFEFSMYIMGQAGNSILNRKRGELIWTNDTNIDADLATGLWNGEGTSDRYPSASGLRRGWNQNFSDFYVEDGDFFRIQNVQLAYNLKGTELLGQDMPDVRIYVTAEKPLTMFNYNGFNPEIPDGIDRQFYPVPAIYTVGLNLEF